LGRMQRLIAKLVVALADEAAGSMLVAAE